VFRDLAADRDGDADVPRRPRRDARARRDPRGGRLRDERTPDRDSRRDPRGRAAAHAPRGGESSTSERWASSRSTRASSIFGRWSRERQSRPKSFPNRTSSTPRSTSSSSEPAGRPTGDRSVPRPPVPDRGAARRCQKLGVGVGLDTFGPDPTPPGSAKTTGPSRETEPEGTPAHDALLSDSLPIVENLCGLDGLPAGFRLYAFPPASGADGSPVRAVAEWEGVTGGVPPRARQTKPVLSVGDESRLKVDIHGNATSFQHVLSQL